MIEPTDEMTTAALEARKHVSISTPESRMRASVLAVLAIVERDYTVSKRIPLRCGAAGFDGMTCQRSPEHGGYHAWSIDGELVKW